MNPAPPTLDLPALLNQHNIAMFDLEQAIGIGHCRNWAQQCHAVSLALVRSGLLAPLGAARVARGTVNGAAGQHSWIVLQTTYPSNQPQSVDVYPYEFSDDAAVVLDLTLWSYDSAVAGVLAVPNTTEPEHNPHRHTPHGSGSCFDSSMPTYHGGEVIDLDPGVTGVELSSSASRFLAMLGPLDRRGWYEVAHLPTRGWPAQEILVAIDAHPRLTALIPIDVLGNATALNPGGLYW